MNLYSCITIVFFGLYNLVHCKFNVKFLHISTYIYIYQCNIQYIDKKLNSTFQRTQTSFPMNSYFDFVANPDELNTTANKLIGQIGELNKSLVGIHQNSLPSQTADPFVEQLLVCHERLGQIKLLLTLSEARLHRNFEEMILKFEGEVGDWTRGTGIMPE